MPRFVYRFTLLGIVIAIIAIFAPISYSAFIDNKGSAIKLEEMQREIDALKTEKLDRCRLARIEQWLSQGGTPAQALLDCP
jgi:uncharacterized membrane protein (DUF106 family)